MVGRHGVEGRYSVEDRNGVEGRYSVEGRHSVEGWVSVEGREWLPSKLFFMTGFMKLVFHR